MSDLTLADIINTTNTNLIKIYLFLSDVKLRNPTIKYCSRM